MIPESQIDLFIQWVEINHGDHDNKDGFSPCDVYKYLQIYKEDRSKNNLYNLIDSLNDTEGQAEWWESWERYLNDNPEYLFEIKITGGGTKSQIISALENVIDTLKLYTEKELNDKIEVEWEDPILMTVISIDESDLY